MRIRIKVCCIASRAEARMAIEHGAAALGLVSAMPSGPGVIGEDAIADIVAGVPPPIATFLLTAAVTAPEIVAQAQRCRPSTLQLVDDPGAAVHRELRARLPGTKLVQVIHVTGEEALDQALDAAGRVDALLLDSGNPRAAVRELGGTGRVHDWAVSRRIVAGSPVPVFLAGGLTPDNAAEAIRAVRPFGLDICSGVRSDGRLDGAKLGRFCAAVAAAA